MGIDVMHDEHNPLIQKAIKALIIAADPVIDKEYKILPPIDMMDARVQLTLGANPYLFAIKTKKNLTRAKLGTIAHQLKNVPNELLVTDYVAPDIADMLKANNIQFIDTVGNAYLHKNECFIYIKGNKREKTAQPRPTTRAFQKKGLQIVFAMMCNPDLLNATYREIEVQANVALGTIGPVLNDLKEMNLLIELGKHGKKFTNKKKLLQRWVEEYPVKLRPDLILGRFTTINPDEFNWWKDTELDHPHTLWGGEIAAEHITLYLKPAIVTIYTTKPAGLLITQHRLKKDPQGEIEILRPFWNTGNIPPDQQYVHPILVYADLVATGDARNIETAHMIYDKILTQYIRED